MQRHLASYQEGNVRAGELELGPGVPVNDDGNTLEALYANHHTRLLRLAVHLTANEQLAEDLTHDAFERVFKKWPVINGNGDGYGYLRTTLINLVRSNYRRRLVEVRYLLKFGRRAEEAYDSPDTDLQLDVLDLLGRLPSGKRVCVALYVYERMSYAEIAKRLGRSESTVRSQISRALDQLEEWMEHPDD